MPTKKLRPLLIASALVLPACPGGGDPTDTDGSSGGETDATSTDATVDPSTTVDTAPPTSEPPTSEPTTSEPTGDTSTTGATETGGTDGTETDGTETGPGLEEIGLPVRLVPQPGIEGLQRINFAVPIAPGLVPAEPQVIVGAGDAEVPAATRVLARHPDGSARSVQIQLDLEVAGEIEIHVGLNVAPTTAPIELVPVEDTLIDSATGPRVWAVLPQPWLADHRVFGPLGIEDDADGPLAAWAELCDYEKFGVDAFLAEIAKPDVWLYDRGTTLYRGHARRGDLGTLRSAYLETTIYRKGLVGEGAATEIGVPGKTGDAKYYYAQNLAMHYLLTGDDRFRESAEDVAEAYAALWDDPGYAGGDDFWTERHAGFGLLAYVWAGIVSDDQADPFATLADEAVAAYLAVQATYPEGYDDQEARCFAHLGVAADEPYEYFGCSPWLSAILADGLEQYATERGGDVAAGVHASLVQLGRSVARDGLDDTGKPFYWMGVGDDMGAPDEFDEHWGEAAYVVALAWRLSGMNDAELKAAADGLVAGFAANGVAPHMRSFNWQCRSAVATPALLAEF